MLSRARRQVFPACLGLIAAQLVAGTARADSATGVDTALGNTLNPPGRSGIPRIRAEEDADTVRHSPTGQMYGMPYDRADQDGVAEDGGWRFTGNASAGVVYVDGDRAALFRKYTDLSTGFYLSHFEGEVTKAPTGNYLQVSGGGANHTDQYYGAQFGQYNGWKVKLFYNETPHVFTDTYKSLYNGAGTGQLTLAGGLSPNGGAKPLTSGSFTAGQTNYFGAASTCSATAPCWQYTAPDGVTRTFSNATAPTGINWTGSGAAAPQPVSPNSIAGSINSYLNTVPGTQELGLVRRKGGLSAEVRLAEGWKAYATAAVERRNGTRPFSMNENNYTVEIPEPIDYTTFDMLAGLTYADPVMQGNIRATGSIFRNNIGTLTVDQPWLSAATGLGAAQTTIFDLYPNNGAFNIKGEFGRTLPFLKTRLTANAAWGTSQQNDTLLMPMDQSQSAQIAAAMGSTVIRGVNNSGYATNTLDLNNWNGVNGNPLSQSSSKQRIDTVLLNAGVAMKPVDAFDLKADFRYRGTYNSGGYTAYNPLTGQFGRGFRNSTSFDLVAGSSGDPGAIGVPCYAPAGYTAPAGCVFNGNAGVTGQSTNNPANVPVVNPPRDVKTLNYVLSAGYDLGKIGSLSLAGDHEDIFRTYRERKQTWENKVKVGYVTKGLDWATIRLSYEGGWRRGTSYDFWPVGDFGTGLPGLDWNTIVTQYSQAATGAGWTIAPAALQGYLSRYAADSRKYDLADRNQNVVNARVNMMPTTDLDLALSFQFKDATYPSSRYGTKGDQVTTLNAEAGYQPMTHLQMGAFYTWQTSSRAMRANTGTNAAGANNTCTFAAGSAPSSVQDAVNQCAQQVWLDDSTWNLRARDQNHVAGVNVQSSFGPVQLGVDYRLSFSKSNVSYDYGPNVLTAAQAAVAGTGFPDMTLTQHTVTAHALIAIHRRVSLHFFYVHETGVISDWHYANLPVGASAAENQATVLLDGGPKNYHTNVVGMLFQFKL